MTAQEPYDQNHREYVPLSTAYIGHLSTGIFSMAGAGLGYWLLAHFLPTLQVPFQPFLAFCLLTLVIGEAANVTLTRPLVIKARRSSPGGQLYALIQIATIPLLALPLSWAFFRDTTISLALFATLLTYRILIALWMKPWKPGLSRSEVRKAYEATKDMVKKDLAQAAQKDAEASPHQELFQQKYNPPQQ